MLTLHDHNPSTAQRIFAKDEVYGAPSLSLFSKSLEGNRKALDLSATLSVLFETAYRLSMHRAVRFASDLPASARIVDEPTLHCKVYNFIRKFGL